jgi:hypothetical protein
MLVQAKKSKAPTLNWRSVKGLMEEPDQLKPATQTATTTNSEAVPTVTRTAACELGLAALNCEEDGNDTTQSPSQSTRSTTMSSRRNGVDITLPFFRDLLSDVPISGADEVVSLGDWSKRAAGSSNSKKKRYLGRRRGKGKSIHSFYNRFYARCL